MDLQRVAHGIIPNDQMEEMIRMRLEFQKYKLILSFFPSFVKYKCPVKSPGLKLWQGRE
jgi:hypothetical protein